MAVKINRLNLRLPYRFANRKLAITRLLNGELRRLNWPEYASIEQLNLGALSVSSHSTNLQIARNIARQIHQHTLRSTQQGMAL